MTGPHLKGITIRGEGESVVIELPEGRWEGNAGDAERLLTALHYALARARPGTSIASLFVDGTLWGGKTVQTDRRVAIREMRALIEQLARKIASLDEEANADVEDVPLA